MRPHDVVVRRRRAPGADVLAPDDRPQQIGLDRPRPPIRRRDARDAVVDAMCRRDDECEVEAGLDPEMRTTDRALRERDTSRAQAVERVTDLRRHDEPRTPRRVVERQGRARLTPAEGRATAWARGSEDRARHIVRSAAPPLGDEQGWIDSGVERRRRVGKILELDDSCFLNEQATHATAGERLPELHRYEKRQYGSRPQQTHGALDEEGGEIHLRPEPAAGVRERGTTLPGTGAEHPESIAE